MLRLFFAPAFGMKPRIHHKPDGTPHLCGEAPKVRIGVFISAHLFGEQFGVEPPAFGIGGKAGLRAEGRDAFELLGDRGLHMVTGQAFMIGDHFQARDRHGTHIGQVGVIDARP